MKPKRITRAHMATIYALILKGKLTPQVDKYVQWYEIDDPHARKNA